MRLWRAGIVLVALAAVPLVASTGADAEPVQGLPGIIPGETRQISPGVVTFEIVRTDPQLHGRVARISPEVVRDRMQVVVSNDAIAEHEGPRRESVTSMCLRVRCVVAVNADQWYVSGTDPSTPVGGTVVDGELWRTPEPDPNPFVSMAQLQFDASGRGDARAAPAGWSAVLVDSEGTPVDVAVNRIPLEGEITLYTHRLGARTPLDPDVVEWAVTIGNVREGETTLTAASGETVGGGNTLAPGGAVLSVRGPVAAAVVGAMLAEPLTLRVDLLGARWAVGGFPVLMEGGEYSIMPNDPANARRDARTIAGWTAAGELLLVTVDERPGWSAGASILEAAQLLRVLGAVEAINLDGGGSTTFVEGGRVTNRPADGTAAPVPRAVVDALVVIPPEGLDFATAAPRVPTTACPSGGPAAPFDDLDTAATHVPTIACVAAKRIASGTAPRTYDPMADVSRAQMATFLERLLLAAGAGVPGDAPDAFTDDDTSIHQAAINRLAAMGIVGGVGGGRYDPEGRVTRAQMATFLARAVWVATGGALTAAEHDYFVDDSIDLHEANINVIAELGVAGGVAPDRYDPGGRVSRAQMASFLARALDAAMTR
jgi:hypothetical protein